MRQITRAAEALVPCTCGELVQGAFNGLPFLVSCPVIDSSRVRLASRLATMIAPSGLRLLPGARVRCRPHPLPYVLGNVQSRRANSQGRVTRLAEG